MATALTVCDGSGMDAEFIVRAGARVISSDPSLGAATRTRERARWFGLDVTPIVVDVEHLPFPDASIDLVLVHDGLHHLERPETGLAEMARVARLRPWDVAAFLSSAGFWPVASQRYVMCYRHEPGPVFRLLSGGPLLPFMKIGWRAGNATFGRVGKKMAVVAERKMRPSVEVAGADDSCDRALRGDCEAVRRRRQRGSHAHHRRRVSLDTVIEHGRAGELV
jgi:SAM-dependent methyltransferase